MEPKQDKLTLMTSRRTPVFVAVAALSACLLHAQTAPKITTPKEALGFNLGDDYQVANYNATGNLLEGSSRTESSHA